MKDHILNANQTKLIFLYFYSVFLSNGQKKYQELKFVVALTPVASQAVLPTSRNCLHLHHFKIYLLSVTTAN